MKKLSILALILVLVMMVAGCSAAESKKDKGDASDKTEKTVEAKQEDTKDDDSEEAEVNAEEATEESDDKEDAGIKLDTSLVGLALLESVDYNPPKKMKITTETTGMGFQSTSVTYYDGDDSRSETTSEDNGTQIHIYIGSEGVTYQYTEGESEGVMILDGEDEDGGMGFTLEAPDFADLVDASSEDIEAKVEMLDGREVIYIKATESDEDYGDADVLMWYSIEYSVPMKYEMHMNGQLMMSYVVTDIEVGKSYDKALFEKPDGIEFMEFDMDALFDF